MSDTIASTVLLIHPDPTTRAELTGMLRAASFSVRAAHAGTGIFEAVHEEPPHCLILPAGMTSGAGKSLLNEMKEDSLFGHLPAIVLVEPDERDGMDWSRVHADDYVVLPVSASELAARVRLSIARAQRDINANPLTGLPGNITIMREAERRLREKRDFALAYLDVDNFKSFRGCLQSVV